jgi:NAD(P)-dependent dehydrogenase (short-subunit alcohol dehydrogenase family)
MGLAAAHVIGKAHDGMAACKVILVGRTVKKLEGAVAELQNDGIVAEAFPADVGDASSLERLASHARDEAIENGGAIAAVIHAAGMSPHMDNADKIMRANALGAINVNNAFFKVMERGSCLIDVDSMSGYFLPNMIIPKKAYRLAWTEPEKAVKKMSALIRFMPKSLKSSVAYAVSKNFVAWFAAHDARRFGEKGVRVVGLSPGFFETAMGDLEKDESEGYLQYCAVRGDDGKPRSGRPEEIVQLIGFITSPRCPYLSGVDILCDGGVVAGKDGC